MKTLQNQIAGCRIKERRVASDHHKSQYKIGNISRGYANDWISLLIFLLQNCKDTLVSSLKASATSATSATYPIISLFTSI
jgi:hypothetical protein